MTEGVELDLASILAGGDEVPENHRSGFICLVGRPNVGKSTLLNAMVGTKVSIVTPIPGTTRNAIRGVVTRDDAQLVFVDTPGVLKPRTLLNQRMNDLVRDTWGGVDVICFVIDAGGGVGPGDRWLAEQLQDVSTPVVCVVNKEDQARGEPLIPVLDEASRLGDWAEVVPTAAIEGFNVGHLADVLVSYLPEGPRLFPAGMVSDQPERQLASEIIREKFITRMRDELPHSIAVVVEDMEEDDERDDLLVINANIYVERDSQKGIVIGKGGKVLAESNRLAREELEAILGMKVYLDVRVKIAKDWQRDPRRLERFGY